MSLIQPQPADVAVYAAGKDIYKDNNMRINIDNNDWNFSLSFIFFSDLNLRCNHIIYMLLNFTSQKWMTGILMIRWWKKEQNYVYENGTNQKLRKVENMKISP